jgi:hypothetical protein
MLDYQRPSAQLNQARAYAQALVSSWPLMAMPLCSPSSAFCNFGFDRINNSTRVVERLSLHSQFNPVKLFIGCFGSLQKHFKGPFLNERPSIAEKCH